MIHLGRMNFSDPKTILYLVGAVSIFGVSGFLCWVLAEIARLIHQANDVVAETREKLSRFEKIVLDIGEKMDSVSRYLGFIAEGGNKVLSFLHKREDDKNTHRKKSKLSRMPDEDEEEE